MWHNVAGAMVHMNLKQRKQQYAGSMRPLTHFVLGLLVGLVVAKFSKPHLLSSKATTQPVSLASAPKSGSGQHCYDYKKTRAVMDEAFQFQCITEPFDVKEYERMRHSWRTMGLARVVMYQNIARYLRSYIKEYRSVGSPKLKTLDISGFQLLQYYPEFSEHLDVTVINWPEWDVLDLSRLPENSFDLALSDQMLEHVQDPFRAQDEVQRVLRPGAVYVYTSCAYNQEHGAPYDYWRFQKGGIRVLARNFAGGLQMCGAWGNAAVIQRTSANPKNSVNLSLMSIGNETAADALAMQLLAWPNDPKQPFSVWAAAKK